MPSKLVKFSVEKNLLIGGICNEYKETCTAVLLSFWALLHYLPFAYLLLNDMRFREKIQDIKKMITEF